MKPSQSRLLCDHIIKVFVFTINNIIISHIPSYPITSHIAVCTQMQRLVQHYQKVSQDSTRQLEARRPNQTVQRKGRFSVARVCIVYVL